MPVERLELLLVDGTVVDLLPELTDWVVLLVVAAVVADCVVFDEVVTPVEL